MPVAVVVPDGNVSGYADAGFNITLKFVTAVCQQRGWLVHALQSGCFGPVRLFLAAWQRTS